MIQVEKCKKLLILSGCGLQLKVVSGMENRQTNTVELKTGESADQFKGKEVNADVLLW